MAYLIEPYRKGQTFATWVRRLTFHFQVKDGDKKHQMFMLGGEYQFNMTEKLYPTEAQLDEVLIQKLRERIDRTESVLVTKISHQFQNSAARRIGKRFHL